MTTLLIREIGAAAAVSKGLENSRSCLFMLFACWLLPQRPPSADTFVDALIQSIQQSSNVSLATQRSAIISRYNAGANMNQSRACALREAIDSTAFVDREYNAAFVLMQYFGYLRRDPDQGGHEFWLGIVNNPSASNYRSMVCVSHVG